MLHQPKHSNAVPAPLMAWYWQNCSAAAAVYRLVTNAKKLTGTLQAILFGNAASGLEAGILEDSYARHLLLDPVCLRISAADCRATSDPYYAVSTLKMWALEQASVILG